MVLPLVIASHLRADKMCRDSFLPGLRPVAALDGGGDVSGYSVAPKIRASSRIRWISVSARRSMAVTR